MALGKCLNLSLCNKRNRTLVQAILVPMKRMSFDASVRFPDGESACGEDAPIEIDRLPNDSNNRAVAEKLRFKIRRQRRLPFTAWFCHLIRQD